MADNVPISAGSGTSIATDDVGGVHYQKIKLALGLDDAVDTLVDSGQQSMANSVPVVIANDQSALTVSAHHVTNAGTFAVQATIASGATSIAKAEDVASADADVGVPAMAVRKASPANVSGTDGDYEFLQMSAGRLWVSAVIDTALPAGTNAIGKLTANSGVVIGSIEIATNQTLSTVTTVDTITTLTGSSIAHDSADSGNPHKIGGKAVSTAPTDVTANDRVNAWFDLKGRIVTAAKSGSASVSQVASSATSVTLLTANTARLGATIHNSSTQILYVKFGATASTTSYTVKMVADSYYEVPFGYSGIIDGIWASAQGNAYVTELS